MKSIFQKIVLACLCVSSLQGASADGSGVKRFNYVKCYSDADGKHFRGEFRAEDYSTPVMIHGMTKAMISFAAAGMLHVMFDPAKPQSQRLSSDFENVQALLNKHAKDAELLQDAPAPKS